MSVLGLMTSTIDSALKCRAGVSSRVHICATEFLDIHLHAIISISFPYANECTWAVSGAQSCAPTSCFDNYLLDFYVQIF